MRLFKCAHCGHKMRFSCSDCGRCHMDKRFYQTSGLWVIVLGLALIGVLTQTLPTVTY